MRAEGQEGTKLIKPKIITPKVVKKKVVPFKPSSRPTQNIKDYSTGPVIKNKIGDFRKIKSNERFAPVKYGHNSDGSLKTSTKHQFEDDRPPKKLAAKLFYTVKNASKEQGLRAYKGLNDKGKKTFWSYAIANQMLDDANISDDFKADRLKYAGSDYFKRQRPITNRLNDAVENQTNIVTRSRGISNEKRLLDSGIYPERQKDYQPIKRAPIVNQPITQTKPVQIPQGQQVQGRGFNPRALPLDVTSQNQQRNLAVSKQEIAQVVANPTIINRFGARYTNSLMQGALVAGMDSKQREEFLSKTGGIAGVAGDIAGMIMSGGIAEAGLKGVGRLAGNKLAQTATRGAIIGGTQQGLQSTSQGKTGIDIAKDVAVGVGLGVVADVGINKVVGAVMKKYGKGINEIPPPQAKKEIEIAVKNMDNGNAPSTIVSGPSKIPTGTSNPLKGKIPTNTASKAVEPITDINEALKYTKSKISTAPMAKVKSLRQKGKDLYQGTVSTNAPIEDIGRLKIGGAKRIAQQAQNISQSGGTVDHILGKDLVGREGTKLGEGLNNSLKNLDKNEQTQLWDMVLNKHNVDRMAQNKPVFGDKITAEMSDKIVKGYETNPKLVEAEKNIRKIIDTTMDEFGVGLDLVSKESLDGIRANVYRAYFPTYREMDKEALQLVKAAGGKLMKKATGSSKKILPPEQQLAAFVNKVVRAGRKNEMYNSLYDAVVKNPDELSSFAQLSKTAEKALKKDTGDALNDAIDAMDNNVKKIGDKYQFTFYKKGEPVTLDVSEQMYKALDNATSDTTLDEVAAGFRKYATGPMKALITGYNPLFAVSNFMRDLPTALLYSTDPVNWALSYPKAIKEIASNSDLWKQYQALGGTRAGLFSYEKGVTLPGNRTVAQKVGKGSLDVLGSFGNITEVLPRFTEFMVTVKKMGNTLDGRIAGLANSAEITTNFTRNGKLTKQADAFVPYLNPAFQGIDRFLRAVRYNPIKTISRGVALMTVPTLILEAVNSKNPEFKEMNQRTKDANYLIPFNGQYIKVPKSRENAVVFSTLFEWISRSAKGEKVDMMQAINTLKTNFSPGDPINSFVLTPLIKTFQQVSNPQAAVKNYANMDIVPTALRGVEPKYQYDLATRELSKAIGEKLNVSPKVIDYLIDSYSGIAGQATRPSTTKTGAGSLLNRFKADPVFQNDNVNKLYALRDKLTVESNTRNLVSEIPSKIVTPEEKRKNALNKVVTEISDLRKEQKSVESENKTMDEKKEKIRNIQQRMNDLAREALMKE